MQIGIDIGGTKMLAIAIAGSQIQHRNQITTSKEIGLAELQLAIDDFINNLPSPPSSIGIAVPGLVDARGSVIASDVLPQLVGWQPQSALSAIAPARALNDAEAALICASEEFPDLPAMAVVVAGTGIGAALAIEGNILRGANGWAGELGSIPIEGDLSLDELASGAAILRSLDLDISQLNDALFHRDEGVMAEINKAGSYLGRGLATVINIFNPAAIVLGGGALQWQGYVDAAIASADRYSLPDLRANCQIHISAYGKDLVARGAAIAPQLAAKSRGEL